MARNFFDNLPSTRTPLTASRLNALLDGDESMGNIVVDSIRSKNMFNMKELIISNCSISNSGNSFTLIGGSAWSYASYYVYLKQGNYTISGSQTTDNGYMELYKENTFIQGLSASSNSTINTQFAISTDGIYEIRCLACQGNIANTTYTNIQLETGSTATSYAPYQELNNQENYSTSEIKIGTWINGNNIYRQTKQISKSSSGLITLLSIPNLDVIVNISTYLKRDDLSGVYKNINNWGHVSSDYGTAFVEGNDIKFDSPYTGTLYITIEYTKTTD